MYRVEVKHAFSMFLKKTQKEIKDNFPDGETKAIQVHYQLDQGSKVEEEVEKAALKESEGILGQMTFQVKIVQEDNSKEILLKAFAYHDWSQPAKLSPKKEWGVMVIPLLIQSSFSILGEKFQRRKMEICLNVSYLQREIQAGGATWSKLIYNQGTTNW